MFQIGSFLYYDLARESYEEGAGWSLSLCSVRIVKVRRSLKRVNRGMVPNATGVRTGSTHGGFFFCSTTIAAASLRSAARSSTWPLMAAGSATPPACYVLAP